MNTPDNLKVSFINLLLYAFACIFIFLFSIHVMFVYHFTKCYYVVFDLSDLLCDIFSIQYLYNIHICLI